MTRMENDRDRERDHEVRQFFPQIGISVNTNSGKNCTADELSQGVNSVWAIAIANFVNNPPTRIPLFPQSRGKGLCTKRGSDPWPHVVFTQMEYNG